MNPTRSWPARGSWLARPSAWMSSASRSIRRRALDHGLTRDRQRDLARPPLHERDAERILELADLGRERRLAHVAALGRAPEMPGFGERDEVFEVTERHRVNLLYTSEQSIG